MLCRDALTVFTQFHSTASIQTRLLFGLRPNACNWACLCQVQECTQRSRVELLREQLKNVAWSSLALRLNGWRYSGPLDPQTVMKAVCGGYTSQPSECNSSQGLPTSLVTASVPFAEMLAAIFFLVSVLIGAFFFYKRHLASSVRRVLREEVMLEVQSQMADYVVMEDGHRPNQRVLSF
eukprot:s823_g1.t1